MTEKRKNTTISVSATGAIASSIGENLIGIKTAMAAGSFVAVVMRADRIQRARRWPGGMQLSDCEK